MNQCTDSVGQCPEGPQGGSAPAGANTAATNAPAGESIGDWHAAAAALQAAAPEHLKEIRPGNLWPAKVGPKPTNPEDVSIDELVRLNESQAKVEAIRLEKEKLKAGQGVRWGQAKPEDVLVEVAMSSDTTAALHYLVEPWLPFKQVIGFYGRGGTAKSSFLATLSAIIARNTGSSTLWISTEEDADWIKVRHIQSGGGDGTLYVFKALVTQTDVNGRAIASTFNVYEHLDAAIRATKMQCAANAPRFADGLERPLRLVVLDTAVALTTWARSEGPNDDKSVKRLIAYLRSICDEHEVTIAIIGHVNKGRHDNLADMVAGSGSWTTSLRQAFMHLYDERGVFSYVACTVKDTLTGPFAAPYTTRPVHTLATRLDGNSSVLCAVDVGALVWGHRNVRELVKVATAKDDEGDGGGQVSSKDATVMKIVTTVAELFIGGATSVTREQVEDVLGRKPHRRYWPDADGVLAMVHGIVTRRVEHGKIVYEKK